MKLHVIPDNLPCYPCPYESRCCSRGTTVTETEARELTRTFGPDTVVPLTDTEAQHREWGDVGDYVYATKVKDGRCILLLDNRCMAYHHPHYPKTCAVYPWKDTVDSTLPQAWDALLCPEVLSP